MWLNGKILASGLPQLWSIWECRHCGYKGALVIEDSKLAVTLKEEWKKKQDTNKT